MMSVEDIEMLNSITKNPVSHNCKRNTRLRAQPCGACDQTCYRGCVEQGKDGNTGFSLFGYTIRNTGKGAYEFGFIALIADKIRLQYKLTF